MPNLHFTFHLIEKVLQISKRWTIWKKMLFYVLINIKIFLIYFKSLGIIFLTLT